MSEDKIDDVHQSNETKKRNTNKPETIEQSLQKEISFSEDLWEYVKELYYNPPKKGQIHDSRYFDLKSRRIRRRKRRNEIIGRYYTQKQEVKS